jgi:hypothetical protein
MEQLKHAAQLAGLDIEAIDFPFLVGGLARMAEWHKAEKHLNAIGRESICTRIREHGQGFINGDIDRATFVQGDKVR